MLIRRENLESIVSIALNYARNIDAERGIEESIFAAGRQETLEAIKRGEPIEISDR